MNVQELQQINFKYVRIVVDGDCKRYINNNFDELLEYIGNHFPVNNRTPIGSAYVKIRQETDKLLRVTKIHNRKLKTSKREISSIRRSNFWLIEGQGKHYYIRIPYKIEFIFSAIIKIVSEISQNEPIPNSLKSCVNLTYGLSFYNYHMAAYDKEYRIHFRYDAQRYDYRDNPARLYDVLHSPANIFDHIFP